MASNPQWCQPLRAWKKYFSTWIATPTAEAILQLRGFLRFPAPLRASSPACRSSSGTICTALLKDQKVFLGYLANMAIKNQPPIGFFKSFVVEKDGEHKDELNLKIKGIAPLVDIVRLFALEKGVRETSTLERIEALRGNAYDCGGIRRRTGAGLRVHHAASDPSPVCADQLGRAPDNFINPNRLSNLEKRSIKEAFQLVCKGAGPDHRTVQVADLVGEAIAECGLRNKNCGAGAMRQKV